MLAQATAGAGAGPVERLHRWATAHPRLAGAGWAVVPLVVLLPEAGRSAGAAGALAALVGVAPLALSRWRPLLGLGLALLVGAVAWALLAGRTASPVAVVVVAVAAVALREGGTRLRWAVAAAGAWLVAVAVAATVLRGGGPPRDALTSFPVLALLLVAAVLVAVGVRQRRARVAALEDRAAQLVAERDKDARIAVADERARIAREVHDVLAHSLTVVVTLADGVAARVERSPDAPLDATSRRALAAVSETGREALGEVRHLLGVLREDATGGGPAAAPGTGGPPAPTTADLDALVAQVRAAGVPVALTREGPSSGWSAATALAVHRLVQESLTNVLRHAGPGASARVLVRSGGGRVDVEVEDDGLGRVGPGRPLGATGSGLGLAGMAARAAACGGSLRAGPRPGGGWAVRAQLADAGAAAAVSP